MSRVAELAWAAGLVDGEGCITILHRLAGGSNGSKTDSFVLVLRVTMGHLETVRRLGGILGIGKVYDHAFRGARANASFSYTVSARVAEKVIRKLRPYLVTKAKEAEVALEFMALPLWLKGGSKGNTVTSRALFRKKLRLYWKIRKLKSRWRFYKSGFYKTRGAVVPIRLGKGR